MFVSCKRLFLIVFIWGPLAAFATADDPFKYVDSNEQMHKVVQVKEENITDVFSNFTTFESTHGKKVKIIALNKITANSKELVVSVGDKIKFGSAELKVYACTQKENAQNISNNLLVELQDTKENPAQSIIFKGWLLSDSPSVSTIQHPVYQFLAINCN